MLVKTNADNVAKGKQCWLSEQCLDGQGCLKVTNFPDVVAKDAKQTYSTAHVCVDISTECQL